MGRPSPFVSPNWHVSACITLRVSRASASCGSDEARFQNNKIFHAAHVLDSPRQHPTTYPLNRCLYSQGSAPTDLRLTQEGRVPNSHWLYSLNLIQYNIRACSAVAPLVTLLLQLLWVPFNNTIAHWSVSIRNTKRTSSSRSPFQCKKGWYLGVLRDVVIPLLTRFISYQEKLRIR